MVASACQQHVGMLRGIRTREGGIKAAMPACALQETLRWRRVDEKFRTSPIKIPRGAFETQEVFRVPRYFFDSQAPSTARHRQGRDRAERGRRGSKASRAAGPTDRRKRRVKGILVGRGLIIVADAWDENALEHPF
jgi:hypothetical protein